MSRRLEVELTSKREDGSYTWRAAGAKQPKGELAGPLLYDGASVGDIVRVDAEFGIDGVEITSVLPPKAKRSQPQTLELLGSGRDESGVTTQLVGKRGRGGRDRDFDDADRGGRTRSGSRTGGRDDKKRGPRDDRKRSQRDKTKGPRGGRTDRPRRERQAAPPPPKAKRLRPKRTHRDAVLRELPEVQQPLARVVLRDGVPGLRQLVEKQNELAKSRKQPEIPPKMLEAVGERLLPRLRTAEWRDNAEAALAGIAEIDLRDIRKVVVAAENGAKDEESRALAEKLKSELTARVDAEQGKWLSELNQLLQEGRTVRALRQSSRPPKAGSPLPADLANKLTEAANQSMTSETSSERWATVLDAVAYSPVRTHVAPQGLPSKVTDELRATVRKLSKRVPDIAKLFQVDAPTAAATIAQIPPPPTLATTNEKVNEQS